MKHFEYDIDEQLMRIATRAIRTRRDLLLLLAHTVKSIIEQEILKKEGFETSVSDSHKLLLYVDKMNRIVYCMGDKIFTYQMPFGIHLSDDCTSIFRFNHTFIIDSVVSSILITVFEDENCFDGTIADVFDRIYELIKTNYDFNGIDEDMIWQLLKHLMIYEPGYVRYDNDPDPERLDAELHPRFHLDINYESSSTFKIGLQNEIIPKTMLSILDNNKKCATLYIP